jgi:hypothetical protein
LYKHLAAFSVQDFDTELMAAKMRLFALTTAVFAQSVVSKCNFFGNAGIDYADTNLSLVTINSTHALSSCCDACTAWNKAGGENCTIGVAYHQGNQTFCALKASTLRPFKSAHATAVQPAPLPDPFPNLNLIILPNDTSIAYGAMCLDGSPPAIYMLPANTTADPTAATKWVLYFKGGGWW